MKPKKKRREPVQPSNKYTKLFTLTPDNNLIYRTDKDHIHFKGMLFGVLIDGQVQGDVAGEWRTKSEIIKLGKFKYYKKKKLG